MAGPLFAFITDNPFRWITRGSSISLAELRRELRTVERQAQVGLAAGPAYRHLFGEADLEQCLSRVRTLAGDPVDFVVYRIFWPLSAPPPPTGANLEAELTEWLGQGENLPEVELLQLAFLKAWARFLAFQEVADLEETYVCLSDLWKEEELPEFLARLLGADEFEIQDPTVIVTGAFYAVIDAVMQATAETALEHWSAGSTETALALIGAIPAWDFAEDSVASALSAFVPVAEALCRRVEAMELPPIEELAKAPACVPEEAPQLLRLSAHLTSYLSQAPLWLDTVDAFYAKWIEAARAHARDRFRQTGEIAEADAILEGLLSLPLTDEIRAEIEAERSEHQQAVQRRPAEPDTPTASPEDSPLIPIKKAPPLRTNLGIGTRMYGQTLFFTFCFLPVLALGRYVVQREGETYYFYGRLPLSRWHKIWNWTVAVLVAVAVGYQHHQDPTLFPELLGLQNYSLPAPVNAPESSPSSGSALSTKEGAASRPEGDRKPAKAEEPDPGRPEMEPAAELVYEPTPARVDAARLERLDGLIQAGKARLNTLKQQLDADDGSISLGEVLLEDVKGALKVSRTELDRFEADVKAGIEVDDAAYQEALDGHNALVEKHNARLASLNETVAARDQRLARYQNAVREHNRLVRDYNALLAEER